MEDRLIELESKIALIEDSYRQLSDEFALQQNELRLATRKIEYLRELIERLQPASESTPVDETPPHY